MKPTRVVISCEHAQNKVPKAYEPLFAKNTEVLDSHESYDFGALPIAIYLSKALNAELSSSTVSRLLIDCNRSLSNPRCFSRFTRNLSKAEKQKLIADFYFPYREETENNIRQHIEQGHQVLHLAIHSFTPIFKGVTRNAAIGLLYDPKRHGEAEVSRLWHEILDNQNPSYKVRKNYPYRGNTDGFTTALRKKYPEKSYLGIELECNQSLLLHKKSAQELTEALGQSILDLLQIL